MNMPQFGYIPMPPKDFVANKKFRVSTLLKCMLIVVGLLSALAAHSESVAIPPEQFMASAVVVRPGVDDFKGMTVRQYVEVMKRIRLNDGTNPKLLGWQRSSNQYALRAQFLDQLFVLRFVHDLSEPSNGRFTLFESAEVDGEPADPMQMTMLFLSASSKGSTQSSAPASQPSAARQDDALAQRGSKSAESSVEQPPGWRVQYQDASCIVSTEASGADGDPPYLIKMGYLRGNQLVFIFSVKNEGYQDFEFPEETQPFFMVDDQQFKALGLCNVGGELVLTIENGLSLQRALNQAKSLGIRVKLPNSTQLVDAAGLDLNNISSAVKWLDTCNVVGVGALPN